MRRLFSIPGACSVLFVLFFVWFIFQWSSEPAKIEGCTASVTRWMVASYSDDDGGWEEVVSDYSELLTVDGALPERFHLVKYKAAYPKYPEIAYPVNERDWYFDRYRERQKTTVHVITDKGLFEERITYHDYCIRNLHKRVMVYTFGGIPQGFDI